MALGADPWGGGVWMLWQLIVLRTEVRLLRNRLEALEAHTSVRGNETHEVT
jgi:hypothetical protein